MHPVFSIRTLGQREDGFSLLEVAIVLAIMALIVGGSFPLMNRYMDTKRRDVTTAHLRAVEDALASYLVTFHRLPAPARNGEGDDEGSETAIGIVPYTRLGLGQDMAKDGHGFFFTYAVEPRFTHQSTSLHDGFCGLKEGGRLGVQDANGRDIASRADNVIAFVLISHGPGGVGSFGVNGVRRHGAASTLESRNNNDGLTFVDAPFSLAHGDGLFRHTVRWHTNRNFAGVCLKSYLWNQGASPAPIQSNPRHGEAQSNDDIGSDDPV